MGFHEGRVMMTASGETETTTPAPGEPEPKAADGMRKLDIAAGGDEVPVGPLGGPAPKTRERLLAEQELASGSEAERAAIDAEKEKAKADAEAAAAAAANQPAPAPAPAPEPAPLT